MIEERVIQKAIENEISFKQLAIELGVSATTISRYAKKYSLKSSIGHNGAKKMHFDTKYFNIIDTEEKAYWLGFIAADGNVHRTNKTGAVNRLQINLKGSDIAHLNKFQCAIGSSYKVYEKTINNSKVCQLKVNSKHMCDDLSKYGVVPRKSISYQPPVLERELIRHFIRGYWDGDGWITSSKRKTSNGYRNNIGIVGGPIALEYFKRFLPNGFSIYKLKCNSNVLSLEASSKKTITLMYDFLYQDATIFLDRKKETFECIMSRLIEI